MAKQDLKSGPEDPKPTMLTIKPTPGLVYVINQSYCILMYYIAFEWRIANMFHVNKAVDFKHDASQHDQLRILLVWSNLAINKLK